VLIRAAATSGGCTVTDDTYTLTNWVRLGRIGIRGGRRGREAHAAVSPRPPNPSYTIVGRTGKYTSLRKCGRCAIVQEPFPVAPPSNNQQITNHCSAAGARGLE
jgi:hypothetical protein